MKQYTVLLSCRSYLLKGAHIFFITLAIFSCKKDFLKQSVSGNTVMEVQNLDLMQLASLPVLDTFTVMSFNTRHNFEGDPQSITERQPLIRQIIIDYQPDIFGVQEFTDASFKTWFLSEMTNLGYGNTYYTYTGSPKTIFYKTSKFNLIDSAEIGLGPISRSGMWAILEYKKSMKRYFVSNSHWENTNEEYRVGNASKLMNAIIPNTQGLPVIVFGDFNAVPDEPAINNLKDTLKVIDALGDRQGNPTFHGWDAVGDNKIDWITSTSDMAFLSSQVITTNYGGYWPSDHWPVIATYVSCVFGSENTDAYGYSGVAATQFYFADINGDGKEDKIYWRNNYDNGKPQAFISNGNGTFASPVIPHTAGASTSATTHYYFADVNGDGKADEIQWDRTLYSGHTRIFLATGSGNFSASFIDNPEGGSAGITTIYNFADVNGDGKADKIYWNCNVDAGHTRVYLATTNGNFNATVVSGAEGSSVTPDTRFYYSDINGDGKADKILWHPSLYSGAPKVYLSDGDGTFTESATLSSSGAGSASGNTQFYFADVNGDGLGDKIYWNPNAYLGKIKIYYSSGSSFIGPLYSLRGNSESANTTYYFADINGDNKKDQIRRNYAEYSGKLKNYFAK